VARHAEGLVGQHARFLFTQIKTIWSTLLREFEFQRDTLPEIDYTTMIHTPKNPYVNFKRRHSVAA
jgi:sterol 14-demethylase